MKVKKIIGIAFLVFGIIGFFYSSNMKNEKNVFNDRISLNKKTELSVDLKGDQIYEIKFWGVDEEMIGVYDQPYFEANIIVRNSQNQILFNQSLLSITEIETGGKRVTHDGIEYSHSPKFDETIIIEVEILKGDYLDIDIYKNLSSEADALPGIFIILAIIGVVLILRSRKKVDK